MSLIVKTTQGKVKGKENKSVLTGKLFYTFQGIPYAKPPIGKLRFQAPQPPEKWEEIYDATYERDICSQMDFYQTKAFLGKEDCLFLNISTPQIPSSIKVPKSVMVFIHGGGFFSGSGSENIYSSDYLIERDVIIITFNYRLHVLGISECPGNAGLKDQVQALKWIKENIANFGGDRENITAFGESAGASSVHYHTISPLSKGLIQKAILQSGSAVAPWALLTNPYEMAFALGKALGFKGEDKEELLNFLKQQDVDDLTKKTMELQEQLLSNEARCSAVAFAPSVEVVEEGAFLLELPEELLENADPLPTICGATDKEGMLAFDVFPNNFLGLMFGDLSIILENNFEIDSALLPEISRKVKQYYLGDEEVGVESMSELANLFTDIFYYRFYEAIDNVLKSSIPVYVYEFAYDGNLNLIKKLLKTPKRILIKGAYHADDLGYLFHQKCLPQFPPIEESDLKVINNLTTLWTNFAKYGNPSNDVYWKPSSVSEPSYLRIDTDLKLVKGNIYGERLQFLRNLLGPVAKPI